jgi:dipeptidyl aminopeptidase/acylaminoacyl peptidase
MHSRSAAPAAALAALLTALATPIAAAPPVAAPLPSIPEIMSRDYIGTSPEAPRWSDDGRAVYFERRRPTTEISDLYRVDIATGRVAEVPDREQGTIDPPDFVESRDHRFKAFSRDGDIFLRDRETGTLRQITRTDEGEGSPLLLLDGRVAWQRGERFEDYDPATGTTSTLAELQFIDDPDAKQPQGFLEQESLRLIDVLRERKARADAADEVDKARRAADPTRAPRPWYLGKGKTLLAAALAPDGLHLAVVVGPERDLSEDEEQGADGGKPNQLAGYVTQSGYAEIRKVRPMVGTGHPKSPELLLLDLAKHAQHEIDFATLPGLDDDPLAALEAAAKAAAASAPAASDDHPKDGEPATGTEPEKAAAKPEPRVVSIEKLIWNASGTELAVQFFSYDNKDRWIAAVAAADSKLTPLERFHDDAWINWRFNDLDWMRDGETLWYLSERSGWSQLYLRPIAGTERALTHGEFEIDAPRLSRDGRSFFVTANREQPGIVEAYRVDAATGAMTRLTAHRGMLDFVVSPDEKQLLLLASHVTEPPELFVQAATPGATERRLTQTAGAGFEKVDWYVPEILAIPSSHGAGKIWSKVTTPRDWQAGKHYPAVMFIHGAGYLQNAHYGFSDYYREFMFASLLAARGYVVIDMDYRASSGYGRDWRTAIYRQMGWPELEDLADGVAWLAAHKGVDPTRVGVWGGSYGGFLTEMAMFRTPDLFACGAALRPVSDWALYNHGYTSNILNTPEVDPEAYRKSSPIEYAAGLAKPLLICHGMVDDNVIFEDSVRMLQRLIELGKTDLFQNAFYPVEKHGFVEPSSWIDEYTRIWNLFEANLWPK